MKVTNIVKKFGIYRFSKIVRIRRLFRFIQFKVINSQNCINRSLQDSAAQQHLRLSGLLILLLKTNDVLDELIRHKKVIKHLKAQRLSSFGHLHRMPEERMIKRVYKWKPMLTRPLGRPKNRWEDDIINDIMKL
jgi:hypothetical protein